MTNPSNIYYVGTERVRGDMRAHTLRIGRLELCSAWLRGTLPSLFYCRPRGLSHPGAVSFTLRVLRVMVGYRWYDAGGQA